MDTSIRFHRLSSVDKRLFLFIFTRFLAAHAPEQPTQDIIQFIESLMDTRPIRTIYVGAYRVRQFRVAAEYLLYNDRLDDLERSYVTSGISKLPTWLQID
jgi:hypothetical protein